MKKCVSFFLLVFPCIGYTCASTQGLSHRNLSFASYYGDHMVLQKAPKRANIWGYASRVSEIVRISLDATPLGTARSRMGPSPGTNVWSFQLPETAPGGPHTLTAETSQEKITLSDVMFGDVWICSGQSNMQFTLNMAFNASDEMADAENHPNIRVFTVTLGGSSTPQYDLLSVEETWSVPSNESLGHSPWSYFSGVCWLYGKYLSSTLKYPIGLLATSYGGTRVELWSSLDALKKCNMDSNTLRVGTNSKQDHDAMGFSSLWNAMVRPLVNMTIYGTIWYQGESNRHADTGVSTYDCTFPAMIDDWRMKFSQGSRSQTSDVFPFGFVQLAPYRNNDTITTGFTDIRWHQTADYGYVPNARMKNTFMAVAMDLPDFSSPYTGIHPRDKQDVAQRLCTEGLAVAYNQTEMVNLRGPFPAAFRVPSVDNRTLVVTYNNQPMGIEIRSNDGFEVCCIQTPTTDVSTYCALSDDVWRPAPIQTSDTTSVTLYYGQACNSKEKPSIGAIRYAWRESPCQFKKCAVYNKIMLPPQHYITSVLSVQRIPIQNMLK
ncbi:sialate O-acetylesterase-like isoform X1 [Haliotis cracherodii]|uniref:sialate O-acetylesterase-like isoform X1 n=1 Tax=Haliotis cracherodii TaxID=6455 RepID=UPI0039E80AD9